MKNEMKTAKFNGYVFQSSIYKTPEFKAFARAFRSDIKTQLKDYPDLELVELNVEHFYAFGFVRKYFPDYGYVYGYFNISDVRFFPGQWHSRILIRTAKDIHDYTGGSNNYTPLKDFAASFNKLLQPERAA